MVGLVVLVVAIVVLLLGSMRLWGPEPTRNRVLLSTMAAIVACTVVWMIIGATLGLPAAPAYQFVPTLVMVGLVVLLSRRARGVLLPESD
ncbi:MAG: hypothetical protein WAW88_03805 [Nocardioides sp.]